MKDLGYDAGAGALPCVARGFAHLIPSSDAWDAPYVSGELDIARAAEKIVDVYRRFGRTLVDEWSTAQSALEHIERSRDRGYPGTWAPTLKFLLIEEVRGRPAALAYLDDPADKFSTIYEKKQLGWLRRNFSEPMG